ncbi:hypothetical protein AgCh_023630 [Apium graveolens]
MLDSNSVYMQQSVDNHENMQMKHKTYQMRQDPRLEDEQKLALEVGTVGLWVGSPGAGDFGIRLEAGGFEVGLEVGSLVLDCLGVGCFEMGIRGVRGLGAGSLVVDIGNYSLGVGRLVAGMLGMGSLGVGNLVVDSGSCSLGVGSLGLHSFAVEIGSCSLGVGLVDNHTVSAHSLADILQGEDMADRHVTSAEAGELP